MTTTSGRVRRVILATVMALVLALPSFAYAGVGGAGESAGTGSDRGSLERPIRDGRGPSRLPGHEGVGGAGESAGVGGATEGVGGAGEGVGGALDGVGGALDKLRDILPDWLLKRLLG